MENNQIRENKMGTVPINKLLISMSLPMMLSMLVQALYNIVDSIFVSYISENALTAVSLAFPFQNLMIAVASGTGVGMNALLSKSLGAKDFKSANRAANTGTFLAIINYVVFAVLGILVSKVFFEFQTDNTEIIEGGYWYLLICTVLSFGIFGQITFERLLVSTGKTIFSMVSQMSGAIINIILDPIMIFGLLGFPKMGVAGAALATVVGQICAAIIGLILNIKVNKEIKLSKEVLKPHGKTAKEIYRVGVPSILMMSIGSVMTFGLNKILIAFTATATAVFGVYFKLQSFIFMPIFGLNNGMVPIVAFNYGAKNKKRVTDTIKYSIIYAVSIMIIGFLAFQIFPGTFLSMFNASAQMLAIGIPALRTISYAFIFAGFCIIAGSVFQALGNGMYSLIVSVARQLVVLLPAAYLLSLTGNVNNVWWSFPIAEIMSLALSAYFLRCIMRDRFN